MTAAARMRIVAAIGVARARARDIAEASYFVTDDDIAKAFAFAGEALGHLADATEEMLACFPKPAKSKRKGGA